MDTMVIENADLLLKRIKKSKKVKAISWGHVHTEYYETIGSVELFSTPSTCYQVKEKPKNNDALRLLISIANELAMPLGLAHPPR